jgi:hypothetical protein
MNSPVEGLKLPPGQNVEPPATEAARMVEDSPPADSLQSSSQNPIPIPLTVDQAFHSVLEHVDHRKIAVQRLKELVLWGSKDDKWFETDMDRYGLYIDIRQTPDGWHAEVQMQPGRIGIADFPAYTWAFAANEVDELCKSVAEDETLPRARRGPKVKYDWPVFQAEFYCRLYRDDIGPRDDINVEHRAKELITWGKESRDIGEKSTPGQTVMRDEIDEWMAIWRSYSGTLPS